MEYIKREKKAIGVYKKKKRKLLEYIKREKKAIGVYKKRKAIGVNNKRKDSYWSI